MPKEKKRNMRMKYIGKTKSPVRNSRTWTDKSASLLIYQVGVSHCKTPAKATKTAASRGEPSPLCGSVGIPMPPIARINER